MDIIAYRRHPVGPFALASQPHRGFLDSHPSPGRHLDVYSVVPTFNGPSRKPLSTCQQVSFLTNRWPEKSWVMRELGPPRRGPRCPFFKNICSFSPTAESFGVSAQICSGVVRGGPEVRFHEGSTRVPRGFHEVLRGLRGGCEH